MNISNSTWRTRISVGLPLLTTGFGFIFVLRAVGTPGVLVVALSALLIGCGGAVFLSSSLSRSIARKIMFAYILLVSTLLLAHLLFIALPAYYAWPRPYSPYIPSIAAPYGLAIRLLLQGGPLTAGLTLGFMLRGMWPRFRRHVEAEARDPQAIVAMLSAVLVTLTFVPPEGVLVWHAWGEVLHDLEKLQLTDDPAAWASTAFMLTLFVIGMVARALGPSSRAFWNRLVVAFAIVFVPAYVLMVVNYLVPSVAGAPEFLIIGLPLYVFLVLVIFVLAVCPLLLGAWTMALIRRRNWRNRYIVQ